MNQEPRTRIEKKTICFGFTWACGVAPPISKHVIGSNVFLLSFYVFVLKTNATIQINYEFRSIWVCFPLLLLFIHWKWHFYLIIPAEWRTLHSVCWCQKWPVKERYPFAFSLFCVWEKGAIISLICCAPHDHRLRKKNCCSIKCLRVYSCSGFQRKKCAIQTQAKTKQNPEKKASAFSWQQTKILFILG